MEAVRQFSVFFAEIGILDLTQVEPIHVAAFVCSRKMAFPATSTSAGARGPNPPPFQTQLAEKPTYRPVCSHEGF